MRTFEIEMRPYDKKQKIFAKSSVTIKPGVTVLVGCNGCGKSTLLHTLEKSISDTDLPAIRFDNMRDGGINSISKAFFLGDVAFGATSLSSSEGERIFLNMLQKSQQIGQIVRVAKESKSKEVWIFLDAVDSGLSIDNIVDIKRDLFDTIIEDTTDSGIDPYIIVSANEYEMVHGENCLDVSTGTYRRFKDYQDYKNFILKSRDKKYKRDEKLMK